ncbi:MAG: ZIP family metal transporter, partial [Thermodesulfovibrionales bacterium]
CSVLVVSLVSLIGIFIIVLQSQSLDRIVFFLVSLAAGSLFGDAFIHLLPEAYRRSEFSVGASLYVLAGIFSFFILEKFIRWRHVHTVHFSETTVHPLGHMNLVADGIHNFIDGVIIGAAYMASLPVGLATTLAVVLHEIPQEMSDYGVLLYAGYSKGKALFFNFLCASFAILGTVLSLVVGSGLKEFSPVMLAVSAGGFIYIAGSDLLPELHKEVKPSKSLLQLLAMGLGIILMLLLTMIE